MVPFAVRHQLPVAVRHVRVDVVAGLGRHVQFDPVNRHVGPLHRLRERCRRHSAAPAIWGLEIIGTETPIGPGSLYGKPFQHDFRTARQSDRAFRSRFQGIGTGYISRPRQCRKTHVFQRLRQRSAAASDFLLHCSSDLEDMPTSSSRNLNAGTALPFRDAFGGGILHPQIGEWVVHLGMSVGRTEPKQKRNSTFSDGGFAHGIFPARPRARPTILAAD